MRQIAYTVLGVILIASFLQPLTEMVEACRKKVVISAALHNSFRAARDRSLTEESIRALDAEVDTELFFDYFSEAFCDSLNFSEARRSEGTSGYIEFESYNEMFNDIKVEIDIDDSSDWYEDKEVTRVTLHTETDYKFNIGSLKLLNDLSKYSNYKLEFDNTYLLLVKN